MCRCCGVHNKSPVIGQCFLVAVSCVAVWCKCIYTNDMAALLHMMMVVVIPCKPVYTGWSKSLCAPDDYNTESRCTETFWSPCISVHCIEVKVIMKGLSPNGQQFLCHPLCPPPLKNSFIFPSKINPLACLSTFLVGSLLKFWHGNWPL